MIKMIAMVRFRGKGKEYAFFTYNEKLKKDDKVKVKGDPEADMFGYARGASFTRYDNDYYFKAERIRRSYRWIQ